MPRSNKISKTYATLRRFSFFDSFFNYFNGTEGFTMCEPLLTTYSLVDKANWREKVRRCVKSSARIALGLLNEKSHIFNLFACMDETGKNFNNSR